MQRQWRQKTWFQAADGTKGSNALVAKEAGVTAGTVANVFRRPEVVIPETKQRVLDAVEKLGYTYNVLPTMKVCTICKTVKPFEDFHTNGTVALRRYNKNIKYLNSLCKDCANKKNKKYHTENRTKITAQQLVSHRRRKYGITEEDYNNMILSQNNLCAICNKSSDKTLHIDHDHITGKIRGLLCSSCNTGIGLFKEDVYSLANAIKYLTSPE
jgi:5-methylcytosine-specific restriction endonuclease McrA